MTAWRPWRGAILIKMFKLVKKGARRGGGKEEQGVEEEEKGWGEAFTFWQSVPLGIFQSHLVNEPGEKAFRVERASRNPAHPFTSCSRMERSAIAPWWGSALTGAAGILPSRP